MDFITHSLMGAGVARAVAPRRDWLPQLSLAGLMGSLLMDGDSWLYLIRPDYYGRYHRVLSHSLIVLGPTVLIGATAAWALGAVRPWRRFGWFVVDNLKSGLEPSRAPWGLMLAVAALAAALHWCGDVITGFGNLCPFWPWSSRDASLRAVFSFDPFIFSLTLGVYLVLRWRDADRRATIFWGGVYLLVVGAYVLGRMSWGRPTFW